MISMADSAIDEPSTGNIYFLVTDLDFTGKDLEKQNNLTALFSMEQFKHCSDPMEPTCARIMVSGSKKVLVNGTDDYSFAFNAMISRHPAAKRWIEGNLF